MSSREPIPLLRFLDIGLELSHCSLSHQLIQVAGVVQIAYQCLSSRQARLTVRNPFQRLPLESIDKYQWHNDLRMGA